MLTEFDIAILSVLFIVGWGSLAFEWLTRKKSPSPPDFMASEPKRMSCGQPGEEDVP